MDNQNEIEELLKQHGQLGLSPNQHHRSQIAKGEPAQEFCDETGRPVLENVLRNAGAKSASENHRPGANASEVTEVANPANKIERT